MIQLTKGSDRMKLFFVVLGIFSFLVTDVLGKSTSTRSNAAPDKALPQPVGMGSNSQGTMLAKNTARSLLDLCGDPLSKFESYITIDYRVVCEALDRSDIVLLENGIMTAYNDVVQPQYCDPYARLISNVTYINETSSGGGTESKVTFLVTGTCQGCDSTLPVHVFGTNNSDDILNPCSSCPVDVIANRSVRRDEFLTLYESFVLTNESQDLVCVTTTAGGVAPTNLPSQSPTTNVEVNCPVDSSVPLTSHLLVTLNENATELTLEELGQDLMDTYNSLMNQTYSSCQSKKYHQITSIALHATTAATSVSTRTGSSAGGRMIRGRQLHGLALSQETYIFDIEGGCGDGCDPSQLFFGPEVFSPIDYMKYYSSIGNVGLEYLSEIEILDCPSETRDFDNFVIVEYVPQDSGIDNSTDLSSDALLMQQLEYLFVQAYNDLWRDFCDPYSRQLLSAKIVEVGAINSFGNIPVEMEVVGTCNNCDGVDLSIYDVPTAVVMPPNGTSNETDLIFFEDTLARRLPSFSYGRMLQSPGSGSATDSSCYCPSHPVGTRGVYETEFIDAYRRVVNEASLGIDAKNVELTANQGLGVTVAECAFGDEFRTSFLFDVQASILTDDERDEIVDSLRQAIVEPFVVTDEVCNPQFRTVDVAESGPDRSEDRRRAQQVSPAPSVAPSLSPSPTSSPWPTFFPVPTETPTPVPLPVPTLTSKDVPFYIYVTGVCNGCENQITFGDQTIDSRRLLEDGVTTSTTTGSSTNDWFRQLESNQSDATSNCFCPIGSEIVSSPTLQDLFDLFVANLRSVGIQNTISNFREVPVVDCTVPVTQFRSQFHYSIALEHNVTADQVQAVGDILRSTYNDLIQDFCDPFDHFIDNIEQVQFVPIGGEIGQNRCQEYDVTLQLTGRCRGCSGADTLFASTNSTTFTVGRRSIHQEDSLLLCRLKTFSDDSHGFASTVDHKSTDNRFSSDKASRRRLQASLGDDCFCDGTIVATRAPTIDEFNMALATALNDFHVTNVCGSPNFMPTPQPTSEPSHRPSLSPTHVPTEAPTDAPTEAPTDAPTPAPTSSPKPTRGHNHGKQTRVPATPAPATVFPPTDAPTNPPG